MKNEAVPEIVFEDKTYRISYLQDTPPYGLDHEFTSRAYVEQKQHDLLGAEIHINVSEGIYTVMDALTFYLKEQLKDKHYKNFPKLVFSGRTANYARPVRIVARKEPGYSGDYYSSGSAGGIRVIVEESRREAALGEPIWQGVEEASRVCRILAMFIKESKYE